MTAKSQIPSPPADDGAIDQALAGLDADLADWAAAMTEAQAALNVISESPAPGPAGGLLLEVSATDPRVADPTPMFGHEPSPDDEPAEPTRAAESSVEEAERTAAAKPFADPSAREEPRSTVTDDTDQSQLDEMLSAEDADALLMAALDPATAYAIRMRRRMTDRKLSAAELMDGLWSGDKSSQAETAKKNKKWWKRRKSER